MTARIRNEDWKQDDNLKSDLLKYVEKNLKKEEILDFVSESYPQYAWSYSTLSLRLSYFDIKYTDYSVPIPVIQEIVREELRGTGQLLGYRALHKKIREVHHLRIPRSLVYAVMEDEDPDGLVQRRIAVKHKLQKKPFKSLGSDHTLSMDGHDKLCGYQKSMFPLSIYGCQDTFSGRMNFLKVWTTNNNPKVIGRFYLEYLYENRVLPNRIRVDRGTETGIMCTMQMFLRNGDDNSVLYGPSTENKIERFWRELSHRLESFFKNQLKQLVEEGHYDSSDDFHRLILAYIYVPIIQKELDLFRVTIWNNHRIRFQKSKYLPCGIPEHIYKFPEKYGGNRCGTHITEENLEEVAGLSEVFQDNTDFLEPWFRQECKNHVPYPEDIIPSEAFLSYCFLKDNFDQNLLN